MADRGNLPYSKNYHIFKSQGLTGAKRYPVTLDVPFPVTRLKVSTGYTITVFGQTADDFTPHNWGVYCDLPFGTRLIGVLNKLQMHATGAGDMKENFVYGDTVGPHNTFEFMFPKLTDVRDTFYLIMPDENSITAGTIYVNFEFIQDVL